jgi:hypothetical protein
MDLDNFFSDLELQLEHDVDAELDSQLHDYERERLSQLTMMDRLSSLTHQSTSLKLSLKAGDLLDARLLRHGKDWIAVHITAPTHLSGEAVIPVWAIEQMIVPSHRAQASIGPAYGEITDRDIDQLSRAPRVIDRISFTVVLRDIARRRKLVTLIADRHYPATVLDLVASDHVDLRTLSGYTLVLRLSKVSAVVMTSV